MSYNKTYLMLKADHPVMMNWRTCFCSLEQENQDPTENILLKNIKPTFYHLFKSSVKRKYTIILMSYTTVCLLLVKFCYTKWQEMKKKKRYPKWMFLFFNKSNFLILCSEKLKCFSDDFSVSSVRLAHVEIQGYSWKFNEKETSYWK